MASQFQHFMKGICKAELDLERLKKKKVCVLAWIQLFPISKSFLCYNMA